MVRKIEMAELSWLPEFTVHSCLMVNAHAAYSFQPTYYCWYLSLSLYIISGTLFPDIGNFPGQYFMPLSYWHLRDHVFFLSHQFSVLFFSILAQSTGYLSIRTLFIIFIIISQHLIHSTKKIIYK